MGYDKGTGRSLQINEMFKKKINYKTKEGKEEDKKVKELEGN